MSAPIESAPAAVLMEAVFPLVFKFPVTFSPPVVSLSVNAPLLVKVPRFATVLLLNSWTVLPVLPINVPVLMIPF